MGSEIAAPGSLLSAMLKREKDATHQRQVAQVEAAEVAAAAAEERLRRARATLEHAPLTGDKEKVDAAVAEKTEAEYALHAAMYSIQKLRGDFMDVDVGCGLPSAEAAAPAPTEINETDFAMVATRGQLIAAFGAFTGMEVSWFKKLQDTPGLLKARKFAGQGGRGHIAEPLFCPFQVMEWLVDPRRKKGRKLSKDRGWQLLELHFQRVYNQYSIGDTRTV